MNRRLLLCLLGLLLGLVGIESLTRVLSTACEWPHLTYAAQLDMKWAMAGNTIPDKKSWILVLGNSKGLAAANPKDMEPILHKAGIDATVYNLAFLGEGLDLSRAMIDRAMSTPNPPKLIIYTVSIYDLVPIAVDYNYRMIAHTPLYECIINPPRTLLQKGNCWIRQHCYSCTKGHYVHQLLSDPSQYWGQPYSEYSMAAIQANQGWLKETHQFVDKPFSTILKQHHRSLTAPSPLTDISLQRLVTQCQQYRVPLLLVWLPENPKVDAFYQAHGQSSLNTFVTYTQRWHQPNQHVWFINMAHSDPNLAHYADLDHVNVIGSQLFSTRLAHTIANQPVLRTLLIRQ